MTSEDIRSSVMLVVKEVVEFMEMIEVLSEKYKDDPEVFDYKLYLKMIREGRDIFRTGIDFKELLYHLAWSPEGYSAIYKLIRYDFLRLSGISKLIEGPVSTFATKKIRQIVRSKFYDNKKPIY